MGWKAMILLAAAIAAGCARYHGLAGVAHGRAQRDFRCSEDATAVFAYNRNTFTAKGCGFESNYQCHRNRTCANLSALAADRAALEYSCQREQVGVVALGAYVFRAQACGHTAIYRCEMRNAFAQCTIEGARGS